MSVSSQDSEIYEPTVLRGRECPVSALMHEMAANLDSDTKIRKVTTLQIGWIYLLIAGTAEVIYAVAMPRTVGFTKFGPSLFCVAFICASMYFLSLSTKTIPIGTAYAVWVGIGAVGTAVFGMRSEEHTSELQSHSNLVCRLLLEKKTWKTW